MTHPQLRIAILCGGTSAEASVSRRSALEVERALRATFADVHLIELGPDLAPTLQKLDPHVVFPALHGGAGEDGTLQGFLELLGIPYVGSGVAACAYAMNKHAAKQIFRAAGLPLARDLLVTRKREIRSAAADIVDAFPMGAVIKPVDQGSALGISFAKNETEAALALRSVFEMSAAALVEERIPGREITCGVLDLTAPQALPVTEIRTKDGWYDYQHRYTPGASQHLLPAPLPRALYEAVQRAAIGAHNALGCRDFSRADFIVSDSGRFCLLEVNTLPGMTATSLYPEAAAAHGVPFEDLMRKLVLAAYERRAKPVTQKAA